MKIRELLPSDISTLREINSRCHPKDAFPELDNLVGASLVITDNKDKIISFGGVELIAEGVTITDNEFSEYARTTALQILLQSMLVTCSRFEKSHLHTFIQDDIPWIKALYAVGFKDVGGKALYKEV